MKTEIADRWIAKLESGEYPQTAGALHRAADTSEAAAGFCCLGVLCEVAIEDGIITKDKKASSLYWYGDDEDGSGAFLPPAVRRWAGLGDDSLYFDVTDIIDDLDGSGASPEQTADGRWVASAIDLNDSMALDFKGIARLIRENKFVDYNKLEFPPEY